MKRSSYMLYDETIELGKRDLNSGRMEKQENMFVVWRLMRQALLYMLGKKVGNGLLM